MRAFRVVRSLGAPLGAHFSVRGGLLRQHAGPLYRSYRAAADAAEIESQNGWGAWVVRRSKNGWQEIGLFEALPNDGMELVEWALSGCHWGQGEIRRRVRNAAALLHADAIADLGRWADTQPDGIVTQTALTEYLIGDFEKLGGFPDGGWPVNPGDENA